MSRACLCTITVALKHLQRLLQVCSSSHEELCTAPLHVCSFVWLCVCCPCPRAFRHLSCGVVSPCALVFLLAQVGVSRVSFLSVLRGFLVRRAALPCASAARVSARVPGSFVGALQTVCGTLVFSSIQLLKKGRMSRWSPQKWCS